MNDRIKELIEAAHGIAYDDDGNELTVMLVGKNLEKFAELMVRECVAPAREPSPTHGMNMAQRILHVGGRNNSAGYIEFGSVQAVEALVRQVLRDLPTPSEVDE